MAKTMEAALMADEFHEALQNTTLSIESDKTAYQKLHNDLVTMEANTANKLLREEGFLYLDEVDKITEDSVARLEEISKLTLGLEISKKGSLEAEVVSAKLLDDKECLEEKLGNVEVEFVANFHNTDAFSNFSNYFTCIDQHEILSALRSEQPDLDIASLEARFCSIELWEEDAGESGLFS
ncbi:hypothetical protein Adt_12110 [Abeliophyllum distichum]|uniref:Uncharacterized protein n=1 Tax=Abeliophyllum distichum TaxID=126358 RepID=A0ABD1UPV6_9LAMI